MVIIEDITEQCRLEEEAREAAAAAERAAAERAAAEKAAAEEAERAAAEAAERQATVGGSAQVPVQADAAASTQGKDAAEQAAEDSSCSQSAPAAAHTQPAELSDAEKEQLAAAEALKKEGNELYAREQFGEALDKYGAALDAAPKAAAAQRAVYHGNRAAAFLKLEQWTDAAQECSAALELQPTYSKVLLRRSTAYEKLDDLERALADVQKVLELEPGNGVADKAAKRLTPVVEERREKLKDEMMGKLKELGNMVLGKFGLSVDNFKADKDPATGSYSIKFQQ